MLIAIVFIVVIVAIIVVWGNIKNLYDIHNKTVQDYDTNFANLSERIKELEKRNNISLAIHSLRLTLRRLILDYSKNHKRYQQTSNLFLC